MLKGRIVWVVALIALIAAACGADPDSGSDDLTTSVPEVNPTTSLQPVEDGAQPADPENGEADPGAPLPVLPDAKIPRAMQPFVDQAVADLAGRLGVTAADIAVATAENVVWPDGAIGCPEPGMAYIQVQVEGSRAVLIHGQESYAYHGGGSRPGPFLCERIES